MAKDVITTRILFEPSSFYSHTHTTFLGKMGMRYNFVLDRDEGKWHKTVYGFLGHICKLVNMTHNLNQSQPLVRLPTSILNLHIFIISNCKSTINWFNSWKVGCPDWQITQQFSGFDHIPTYLLLYDLPLGEQILAQKIFTYSKWFIVENIFGKICLFSSVWLCS